MTRKEMFEALFEPKNGWADQRTVDEEFAAFEKLKVMGYEYPSVILGKLGHDDGISGSELYQLVLSKNIPAEHHESDLYIPVTEETDRLVSLYKHKNDVTRFKSAIPDAVQWWYDIPFAYMPFWEKKNRGCHE